MRVLAIGWTLVVAIVASSASLIGLVEGGQAIALAVFLWSLGAGVFLVMRSLLRGAARLPRIFRQVAGHKGVGLGGWLQGIGGPVVAMAGNALVGAVGFALFWGAGYYVLHQSDAGNGTVLDRIHWLTNHMPSKPADVVNNFLEKANGSLGSTAIVGATSLMAFMLLGGGALALVEVARFHITEQIRRYRLSRTKDYPFVSAWYLNVGASYDKGLEALQKARASAAPSDVVCPKEDGSWWHVADVVGQESGDDQLQAVRAKALEQRAWTDRLESA